MTALRPARLSLTAAALWLAACAPESPTDPAAPSAGPAAARALGPTLRAHRWRLEAATDAAGRSLTALFPGPENRLGLEFAEGQVGVSGGCNRIAASYRLVEPSRLEVGPGRSTMMACPPPLAAADAEITRLLTGTLQAHLEGTPAAPVLRLVASDGSVLRLAGTPTPETRFGGPGTRAFLEVSPEPCDAPHDAAKGCLKVRDLHFDEQGLRVGEPGAWRPLPGGIEGYAPRPGEQQVVRVKRFETPAAAGGAPVVHYVFDLVVESRTVR